MTELPGGSYVPLITPLRDDGAPDEPALHRLVDHALDGGCTGVLALGSAGETAALGRDRRRTVMAMASAAVGSRAQLLIGIAQCSLDDAVDEARAAAETGARAVVATPPFYGPADEATVERFYVMLAERSPLPVLAYNIPGFTGVAVPPGVIGRLVAAGVLAGVKDSGRDLEYTQRVLAAVAGTPGVSVFMGSDTLILPALLLGATGSISLAANVVPAWTSSLCDAVRAGDLTGARELQDKLSRVTFALRAGVFPAGAKAALAMLGICGPACAGPVPTLSGPARRELATALVAEGVISHAETVVDSTERRSA